MDSYILDEELNVVPISDQDLVKYIRVYGNPRKHITFNYVDSILISTIFLCIPAYGHTLESPPDLFETRIFGGELDSKQLRYATYEEAIVGHQAIAALVEAIQKRKLL